MSARLPDYLVVDLTRRVEEHLARIAARDWDYFARQRYSQDAELALSDFRRLDAHYRLLAATPESAGGGRG